MKLLQTLFHRQAPILKRGCTIQIQGSQNGGGILIQDRQLGGFLCLYLRHPSREILAILMRLLLHTDAQIRLDAMIQDINDGHR